MESQHISNGDMTRAARILVKVSAQYICLLYTSDAADE